MTREALRKQSELYGREYDQGKVNTTIYTFISNRSDQFPSLKLSLEVGRLDYTAIHKFGSH